MSDETMSDDETGQAGSVDSGVNADPGAPDEGPNVGLPDSLRHTGVGTDDPNIIGDAGPLDVAPGSEGEADILFPDATDVDHVEI